MSGPIRSGLTARTSSPMRFGGRPSSGAVRTGWGAPDTPAGSVAELDDLIDVVVGPRDVGVLIRDDDGIASFQNPTRYHEQDDPVVTWLVTHDLPYVPESVTVTGTNGQVLYPSRVTHLSGGRAVLEFTRPVAGTAAFR